MMILPPSSKLIEKRPLGLLDLVIVWVEFIIVSHTTPLFDPEKDFQYISLLLIPVQYYGIKFDVIFSVIRVISQVSSLNSVTFQSSRTRSLSLAECLCRYDFTNKYHSSHPFILPDTNLPDFLLISILLYLTPNIK